VCSGGDVRRSLLNQGRLIHVDTPGQGQGNGHTAVAPGEEGKGGRRGRGTGFSRLSHHPLWHGPMLCAEGAGAVIRQVQQQAEEGEVREKKREEGGREGEEKRGSWRGSICCSIQSLRIQG
jgi:hypothetical protein